MPVWLHVILVIALLITAPLWVMLLFIIWDLLGIIRFS